MRCEDLTCSPRASCRRWARRVRRVLGASPMAGLLAMALLRVDAVPLLPALRSELMALLGALETSDWQAPTSCPGWSVHAVACHLLGGEAANVSARRDDWKIIPKPGEDADKWLDTFNEEWVEAAKRLSPAVVVDLLSLAGRRFEEYVATLDMDAVGGPVGWATGTGPAPAWLDVAREYMERFVHQYQIREAVGKPALGPYFIAPALATAVHCLPKALSGLDRPPGTSVLFVAEGDGGGAWNVLRTADRWELATTSPAAPACEVRTSVDGALKLFVRDANVPALNWRGDRELASAVERAKAVLGSPGM